MANTNSVISFVLPVYNEEGNLNVLYERIKRECVSSKVDYEIIFVDDGSSDSSLDIMKEIKKSDNKVTYVSLSRNFGHQSALFAGMAYAKGDAVITMDADLQHPPTIIPEMIELWRRGKQVVYTVKKVTHLSPVKRLITKASYAFISKISHLKLDFGQSDFRLIDKKILKIIMEMPEYHKFLRGQVSWIGFEQAAIPYNVEKRFSGKAKYSYKDLYELALDGIFSFGKYPLHLVMLLSLTVFSISAVYIFLVFINRILQIVGLLHVPMPPGWTTIVMSVFFLGSIQLMAIGILSEYVGRVYDQAKKRPVFIVKEDSRAK